MYPDEQACKLIDELLRKGITRTTELSDILKQEHGIKVEPHFISEYKHKEIMKRVTS
jgi:hypothetical protein